MIKYNTIVEVLSGFYEGTKAHVIKEDKWVAGQDDENKDAYSYQYKLITSWGHETTWIEEKHLKPILGSTIQRNFAGYEGELSDAKEEG
jgi:hypothetical protein